MKIGFFSPVEDTDLVEEVPNTTTVIKCPACEKKFYYPDFHEEHSADACDCKNRNITIGLVSFEDSGYDWYIGVKYKTDYPEFYDLPYSDYLKAKEDLEERDQEH